MSDEQFPEALKPIVNLGYGFSRGANVYRSNIYGGIRQNRDLYFDIVPIDVNLLTSQLGMAAFWDFYDNKINSGASSFFMNLDSGYGIQQHLVYITSNEIPCNSSDGINWAISFTATAERIPGQESPEYCGNLAELYGCQGDNLCTVIDGMADLVENYFPLGSGQ